MNKPHLIIIAPCFNEEKVIEKFSNEVVDKINKLIESNTINENSSLLLINDGSSDNTWNKICELKNKFSVRLSAISLSRNFGHQSALLAGLTEAKNADIVITLDSDMQHDLDIIEAFISSFKSGNEIVLGIRSKDKTTGIFKNLTSTLFYKLLHLMSVKIEPNHPDCRLISKEPLRAILDHSEKTLFLRGLIHTIGYKVARVELKIHPRFAGETKYTMGKMINFSIDGITSSTAFPLRIIFISGLVIALLSFLMILYIIVSKLLGMTLPGWTSIVVPIYFLGGIQLIFMGVIGEYLSKVFSEVKNRPHYIVSDKI